MNVLARLLAVHMPGPVKSRILDELFRATARGFDRVAPPTTGQSPDGRLAAYARFTRDEAERAIGSGQDLTDLRARLRAEAYALGLRLRGVLGVEGRAEALVVARPLYHAIGIDFRGTPAGDVTVRRCYFADRYTPGVCGLVSALDEGLLAGLAGGGRLEFTQRLTEGADQCRARFAVEEART